LCTAIPQINTQERVRRFVAEWRSLPEQPSPGEMALLLESVSAALIHQRQKQKIELIWTGPKTHDINLRRTNQALLELIHVAKTKIIIVSFVVYKVRDILSALEKAALRGVEIIIVLESPDDSEGKIAYSAIAALGSSLRIKANVFIWPYAKRPVNTNGMVGLLHAKVGVADNNLLYISSANLTDNAMNLNMEMGVLICGGELPGRVGQHFEEMITNGTLIEITAEERGK
jgi:phosphatidylserine/phosphatidylglycerophosphate/cardiolipin synthase-like enzyme